MDAGEPRVTEERTRPAALSSHVVPWAWVLVVLLALATVLTFAGRLAWFLELTTHFRLQLLYAAFVAIVLFALCRHLRGAAVALALFVVNGALVVPFYTGRPDASDGQGPVLRLLIANVHTANREHRRLIRLVRDEDPDVVMLEETDRAWLASLEPLAGVYPHTISRARADNFGIALYSKLPFDKTEVREYGSSGVPSVLVRIRRHGELVSLVLTHPVPPVGRRNAARRDEQARSVAMAVRGLGPRRVLAGDFNMTPWSPVFADMLAQSGMRDSERGFGVQPTWPVNLPAPCRIPIDHCLYGEGLVVTNRRVGPDIGSDHLPLIVDLRARGSAP